MAGKIPTMIQAIKRNYFLFIFITIFLFLRFYHLEASLNFSGDQGMHLLDMWKIYHTNNITLIGPPSSFTVFGRSFYTGSAPYYFMIPLLVLTNWNPISVSYLLIIFQLVVIIDLYKVIAGSDKKTAGYFLSLCTFSTILIDYSRFLWHPNFLIPIGGLVLGILIYLFKKKKGKKALFGADFFRYLTLGLILGLGLQFHYSFLLAILLAVVWLIIIKQLNILRTLLLIMGFITGFFPIILFEIRHNFYNLRTLILFLTVKTGNTAPQFFNPPVYYFFPVILAVFLGIARLLAKLNYKNKIIPFIFMTVFVIYALTKELPSPQEGFKMADGWNYQGIKKVEQIILDENRPDYNIVDILTGDSRALAIRFLLTRDGAPPMGVIDYPQAKSLFIYSKVPSEIILRGEMWEVGSALPLTLTKEWNLQNGINLYLLEKSI